MAKFKKFSGNYIEVMDKIDSRFLKFYEEQTLAEYNDQVKKDLHRTGYFSYDHTVVEMQKRLRDTAHLTAHGKPISYTQGNFDGSAFTETYIRFMPTYPQKASVAGEDVDTLPNFTNSIRIAYVDDNGNNCAFSIVYLRQDPDITNGEPFVEEAQRKRSFLIAHIKNTTFAPTEREVTLFADKDFLTPINSVNGEDIEDQALTIELKEKINSKKLNALLEGLITEGSLSTEHFDELNARLKTGENIDNRDFKKVGLDDVIKFARATLAHDLAFQEYINEIEQRSLTEIDFFKEGTETFKQAVEGIFAKIATYIEQLEEPETKKTLVFKHELTSLAIELDFEARTSTDDKQQAARLLAQANALRELRDKPSDVVESYKNVDFSELVSQIERKVLRVEQLENLLQSKQVKRPTDTVLQDRIAEIKKASPIDANFFNDDQFEPRFQSLSNEFDIYIENEEKKEALILNENLKIYSTQLEELAKTLVERPELCPSYLHQALLEKTKALREIEDNAKKDYKNERFSDIVSEALSNGFTNEQARITSEYDEQRKQSQPPKPIPAQGFFQRNRTSILIGVFAVFTLVILALILSGVLAPLAAGIVTTIAIVGADTAGGIIVATGTKIAYDERQFTKSKQDHVEAMEAYQNQLSVIDNQHKEEMRAFSANFDAVNAKIMAVAEEEILVAVDSSDDDELLQRMIERIDVAEVAVEEGLQIKVKPPLVSTPLDKQQVLKNEKEFQGEVPPVNDTSKSINNI